MEAEMVKKYTIASFDLDRPWGKFYCIARSDLDKFIQEYFPNIYSDKSSADLSPKILVINPNKKLSWQYHNRRKEIWSIVSGPVGIVLSADDTESDIIIAQTGEIILIDVNERHRLVGLSTVAIVAELWVHVDPKNLSSEDDIIRVQDDFHRNIN